MTDTEALAYDFFADDRDTSGIVHPTKKIVITRKPHTCMALSRESMHEIATGERVRRDHAFVDGKPRSFYTCIRCIEVMAWEGMFL